MIPMGTVMTACMILCVLFANRFPNGALNARVPAAALRVVGAISVAAGLWNVLWHALRHLTHFWGQMALGSGMLLCALGALLLLRTSQIPEQLEKARQVMVLALAAFAAYYAWTIYNL